MTRIEKIKLEIKELSLSERGELARWFHGWPDDDWDRQMKADAEAGRFDRILKEVDAQIDAGKLRDLP